MTTDLRSLGDLAATYRDEAGERLDDLEVVLLELEGRPGDAELVDRAFRALHTIKGSGAMFGFDEIAAFTHELETLFEAVRSGHLGVTGALVGAALDGKDLIRAMLDGAGAVEEADRARLVAAFRALMPRQVGEPPPGERAPVADEAPPATAERAYRLRFTPRPDLLQDGTNPLSLLAELRSLGPCELAADASRIPLLEELSPETCYVGWEGTVTTDRGVDAIRDVFIFVEDRCELGIEPLDEPPPAPPPPSSAPAPVVGGDPPFAPSVAAQRRARGAGEGRERSGAPEAAASSVRVAAEKLDRLVDLVGELVIAQARLARAATRREDPELLAVSEDIERLSTELRDSTLGIRMVPIGTTFSRFKRVTRDLAAELGKEIELVTSGAETELDKTVIEQLGDPLVHIIRNSCDHGIEAPDVRRAAGKPAQGTVRLSAYQAGANVVVEVSDDGAGLDRAAIRARAVERGLIAPDAKLSDQELNNLVFLPGFSTARAVSNLSGRGVGMDVVKRSVEALRGTVHLDGERGVGATIRIELPLTLAIIEGLLVAVGDASYVLPSSIVEECVELTREDVEARRGSRVAAVRGELVPYVHLRHLFGVLGEPPPVEQIAIVRIGGTRHGVVVDHVVGHHQTVIKSLGRLYRDVKGLSGATILGDGTVALIVDVPELFRSIASPTAAS